MNKDIILRKILNEDYIKDRPICAFGTGSVGTNNGYKYLKILFQKEKCIDYYVDNDSMKWGERINDIPCISPKDLYSLRNPFVFVLISPNASKEVEDQLRRMDIEFITYSDLIESELILDMFIDGKGKTVSDQFEEQRICPRDYQVRSIDNAECSDFVVYTCIIGGYDILLEPSYVADNCDYILISDFEPPKSSIWKYINVYDVTPRYITDNYRLNRFCKIHGCELFSHYSYSIYLDGNMLINGDLRSYIRKIGKSGIGMFPLTGPGGNCIYKHGLQMADTRVPADIVRRQLKQYKKEGLPKNYGAMACYFIVRDNHNILTRKLMREWWKEVYEKSWRDQISFMYVLWKNGMTEKDIGCLGNDIKLINEITRFPH